MFRRDMSRAIALAGSLVVAVSMAAGCGDVPTAPFSPSEEGEFIGDVSTPGSASLAASPPAGGGDACPQTGVQPDFGGQWSKVTAAPSDDKGQDGAKSRYALAKVNAGS